jgi:GNAT superfamily N-acetyltransferase
MPRFRLERVGADRLAEVRQTLLDVYAEVYEDELGDPFFSVGRFDQRLGAHAANPSWEVVIGYDGEEPVGYAYGATLRAGTGWWEGTDPPLPADVTAEDGARTMALYELMVRKPWRKTGVSKLLHDTLREGRAEERVTLLVESSHARVRALYERWGYRRVAGLRPFRDAPPYDVMLLGGSRSTV